MLSEITLNCNSKAAKKLYFFAKNTVKSKIRSIFLFPPTSKTAGDSRQDAPRPFGLKALPAPRHFLRCDKHREKQKGPILSDESLLGSG